MKWKKLCAAALAFSLCLGMAPYATLHAAESGTAETATESAGTEQIVGRETQNFNQGWKFKREYNAEAIDPDFDMEELKKWENVDLPHTVRLEKYMNSGPGETYQGDAMYVKHFPLSDAYEGKKLYLEFEGAMGVSNVWVNGEHMTTKLASKTGEDTMYGGYLPFIIDITDVVKYDGTDNVITVHVTNENNPDVPPGTPSENMDFTYFGGIYRGVWLEVCDPVHITDANFEDIVAGGGILVDYRDVSTESAIVDVNTHVRNETASEADIELKTQIIDADANIVAEQTAGTETLSAGSDYTFIQSITVDNPKLWDLDSPYMHTLVSTVLVDGKETDRVETPIGIREIELGRDFGLKINGVVQDALIGTNRHQEYPYIGYAASSSLQRRDAIKFKEAGINVVRTGHYPQSKDFLDACDELGILVIEPTPGWQWWRNNDTFKNRVLNDIRQMVRRDRNRPCILAYETVLNETSAAPGTFTQEMARTAKEEHPSAKTATENSLQNMSSSATDSVSDIMYKDAQRGTNAVAFQREYGDSYREQYSENNLFYRRVSRGEGGFYPGGEGAMFMQAVKRLMGNQDDTPYYCAKDAASASSGGAKGSERSFLSMAEWADRTRDESSTEPVFIGSTSWIGIDHNRSYEDNPALCGFWDLYRIPKFSYYAMASQRDVETNDFLTEKGIESGPLVFISSYWTETAPKLDKSNEAFDTLGTDEERIILVYSNAEKIRLTLYKEGTDEQLWQDEASPMTGKNRELLNHAPFQFENVPYASNSYIQAEGLDADGNVIAEHTVHTAKEPAKLRLEADDEGIALTADGSDLMMLHAYIEDENGNVCNTADNELKFTVLEGDAKIVGDGVERIGANPVKAEAGITGAYIQAGKTAGKIIVKVEAEGLEPAQIELTSQPMTEKAAPYTEIEYTGTGEELSGYLTSKEQLETWEGTGLQMEKGAITVGSEKYRNSISVINNMTLRYELEGKYKTLSGKVYVKPEDSSKEAIFRIYVDGVEKYASSPVKSGEIQDFYVNVSGGQELVMTAEDQNTDIDSKHSLVWLSPYIYEGNSGTDESELYQNLALNKPAVSSSNVDQTSAAMANDGDVSTIWRGEEVHSGESANPQEWIVDLGENYNVRNARVGLEHDSIGYTYEIATSSDGNEWTTQCETTKTSQASDVIDVFTAQNVRYVKVRFTSIDEHADRGQMSNATISEFEVYKDLGVESTDEFSLKGLSIENKDLVFDPAVRQYTISLQGFESSLRVKALPVSPDAVVTINGQTVTVPEGASSLDDAVPVVLTDLGDSNEIVVTVTSPSGASSTYTVAVQGTLGALYHSSPVLFKTISGSDADHWSFGERNSSGEISYLSDVRFAKNGEFYMQGSDTYLRSGKRYTHPTSNYQAVKTFTAPKSGTLAVSLSAQKYATNVGKVGIFVLKNNSTKLWPSDSEYEVISTTERVSSQFQVTVAAGDQIQFLLDDIDGEASDATCLEPTVRYIEDLAVTKAVISGPAHIRVSDHAAETAKYQLDLTADNGTVLENIDAAWTLGTPVEGISLSGDGLLTIEGSAAEQEIKIQAASKWNENILAKKIVKITKHSYETNEVYVSSLKWEDSSQPTGWGVTGIDKVLSKDGSDNTKLSLSTDSGQQQVYDRGLGVNSYSELIYNVEGKGYTRFESWVGIDYAKRNMANASVTFEVWADGQKLYDSGNMGPKTAQKFVSVDITGARQIKLIATMGSDGTNGNDNADWADAKFISVKDTTQYNISGAIQPGTTGLTDLSGIKITLYAKDDTQFEHPIASGTTEIDGSFILDKEITAGNYVLRTEAAEGFYKEAVCEVTVNGDDITDAALFLEPEREESDALKALKAILALADISDQSGAEESVINELSSAVTDGKKLVEKAGQQEGSVTDEEFISALERIWEPLSKLTISSSDKTVLENLISAADQIDLADYLLKGQYEFQQALLNAKKASADPETSDETISAAIQDLWKTVQELEKIPDKSVLSDLLDSAYAVDRSLYTENSLDQLDQSVDSAIRVMNDMLVGKSQVTEAEDNLQYALEHLTEKDTEDPEQPETVSKKTLEYFLNSAKKHFAAGDVDSCVESVQKLFEEAIAEGEAVIADENATRDEVINASFKLMSAIHALNMKMADKTDLEMAAELAGMIDLTDYIEAGQHEFRDALTNAENILTDGDAMQADVDTAWKALVTAMENLRLKANKDVLQALLNESENLDLTRYTEESAAVFRSALASAQAVFADPSLCADDQQEVDKAAEILKQARDSLTLLEEVSGDGAGDGREPNDERQDGSTDSSHRGFSYAEENNSTATAVKTGDNVSVSIAFLLCFTSAGLICFLAFNRRKQYHR